MAWVGTDIEEIDRFEGLTLRSHRRFLERIFVKQELAYCFSKKNPAQHLAARFCAKEAVVKALGSAGLSGIGYKDIVIEGAGGAPKVRIGGRRKKYDIAVSMSHAGDYAVACAIITL